MTCRKLLLEYNARAASRRARGTVPRCATKKQTLFGTLAPHGERGGVAFPLRGGAPVSETAGRYDRLLALMIQTPDEPGILHELTRVILEHRANITYVDIAERREDGSTIYFELEDVPDPATLIFDLNALSIVRAVERAPSFQKVYGKRIIVIGGGAQVSAGGGAGPGGCAHWGRGCPGRLRDTREGHHRALAEYAGQRNRSRGPGGERPCPVRRNGCDGRLRVGPFRYPPSARAALLARHPTAPASVRRLLRYPAPGNKRETHF